jgi:anti-sigma factor RsiW
MNCKQVQELLPLYVGRDLEEKRAQMVTAHLQSCAECAASADEYRGTRQLLQQFAPPPFSDAVYAGIRQRVLRDIEREATAPGLSRLLESLFRPRLRWAVATALLLAVSVSAFFFIANRKNDQQQLAGSGGKVAGPASTSIKESAGIPPASTVKNRGSAQGSTGGTHQPQRRRSPGVAADRTRLATIKGADKRSLSVQTSSNGRSEPDAFPSRDSATSEKTLRVEMQTEDPNIRIIWFSPQPTRKDSPGKFSKGT